MNEALQKLIYAESAVCDLYLANQDNKQLFRALALVQDAVQIVKQQNELNCELETPKF